MDIIVEVVCTVPLMIVIQVITNNNIMWRNGVREKKHTYSWSRAAQFFLIIFNYFTPRYTY
jgi:hypothetical protein